MLNCLNIRDGIPRRLANTIPRKLSGEFVCQQKLIRHHNEYRKNLLAICKLPADSDYWNWFDFFKEDCESGILHNSYGIRGIYFAYFGIGLSWQAWRFVSMIKYAQRLFLSVGTKLPPGDVYLGGDGANPLTSTKKTFFGSDVLRCLYLLSGKNRLHFTWKNLCVTYKSGFPSHICIWKEIVASSFCICILSHAYTSGPCIIWLRHRLLNTSGGILSLPSQRE